MSLTTFNNKKYISDGMKLFNNELAKIPISQELIATAKSSRKTTEQVRLQEKQKIQSQANIDAEIKEKEDQQEIENLTNHLKNLKEKLESKKEAENVIMKNISDKISGLIPGTKNESSSVVYLQSLMDSVKRLRDEEHASQSEINLIESKIKKKSGQ
jgi:hypothetical protein